MRARMISSGCKALLPMLLTAALVGCGGGAAIKQGTSDATAPGQYDMTVRADKDGQFDYDNGATLTAEDLRSRIRYLDDPAVNRTVHTILLKRGEKDKINNTHVLALASICRDLKIEGYVLDNDGHLKILQIDESK